MQSAVGLRGIAPGAKLTSVKVGAAGGAVDVSQILAAINWVVAHRNDDPQNPIRVITLAYGTDSNAISASDPLLFAVQQAWNVGITVVCASGNGGAALDRLNNPGSDQTLMSVGSANGMGTLTQADDRLSTFTSVDTDRILDFVAPGEAIVSLRNPGLSIDQAYPTARVGTDLLRGSGTSQAAAVVSGAVALLAQKYPKATAAGIRLWLRATASPLVGTNASLATGQLNLRAALKAAPPTRMLTIAGSNGTGSLEASRGSTHLVQDNAVLRGDVDLFGPFSTTAWASAVKNGIAWKGGVWMGRRMAGDGWTGTSWASKTWAAATWPGTNWAAQSWADSAWSGRYWSGRYWSASNWTGRYWSSSTWEGKNWSATGWK